MTSVEIETTRFGKVEIEENTILTFISPILGFEELKSFVILDHTENSPFRWLQSVEDGSLAFVMTNPKFFGIPYEFSLSEGDATKLDVETAEDVLVFTIVNIPNDNPSLMTANLLAPIIVNQGTLKAMQLILQDVSLSTRTRLLPDAPTANPAGTREIR